MTTSYIIPAFNEELLLEDTLISLKEACTQLEIPFEIIVVNDNSTDQTEAIALKNEVKVITVDLHNIAGVRNAGADIATGDLLCFIDADTLVNQNTLQAMHTAIKEGIIGGGAKLQMDANTPRWGKFWTWWFTQIYFRLKFAAGCYVFATRDAFDKAGGFDDTYFAAEEVFLSKKLKKLGPFKILSQSVTTSGRKMRLHGRWQTIKHIFSIMRYGLNSRKGLDLWYDGQRETSKQSKK
ncbi:MAG: glycosyl transferase family 2 [Planctomycetota bacterium]|nr:MAG: glycosyl transferase family 2 [Planctomycetota bacterium]